MTGRWVERHPLIGLGLIVTLWAFAMGINEGMTW
jgi:hypothetical protein